MGVFSTNLIISKVKQDKRFNEAFDDLINRFLSSYDGKLLHPVLYFHDLMHSDLTSSVSKNLD